MSSIFTNRHERIQGRSQVGFTLIELMVVVAIIAILGAIALPSYTKSVTKTKRRAAEACLSEYANYMERYYTTNLNYKQDTAGTANAPPTLDCASTAQTGNDYTYALVAANTTATTFLYQAAPKAGSAQAKNDTTCGTLSLDQTGARLPATTDCW